MATQSKRDVVSLKLTRVEAAALLHTANVGFRVIEALGPMVQQTASTEAAITKLGAALAASERSARAKSRPTRP
jgi:predicted DNA-binding transcriptional regulator YafY